MKRNPELNSEFDIVTEKALNLAYERGWKDCKKAILTLINKLSDYNDLLDKEDVVKIVEKV